MRREPGMVACLRMSRKITKHFVKYSNALHYIYENPCCICGSKHPDEMEYQLPNENVAYHTEDCPSVIAGIALGELEKL